MERLKGKKTLVTGGASGIGAATVKRFIEEGARVCVFDWNEGACKAIQEENPALEKVLAVDVSDVNQVEDAFIEIDAFWGGLDVLINNAGISIRRKFLDITPEEWIKIQNVNLN